MNTINAVLSFVTDALFLPLTRFPPLVLLIVVSVLAGILMAVVFRFTSQQKALRRVADLSRAQVLAIKLFRDDLGTMFTSLGRLFRYTAMRLWYSLPPALVMVVPFVLLLVQMARWYEYQPLVRGDKAILEMQLAENAWQRFAEVTLEPAAGVEIERGPHHDETIHTIAWRIRAGEAHPAVIHWALGEERGEKQVAAAATGQSLVAVDRRVPGAGWWDRLMHPGETGLDKDSAVRNIVIHYDRRETPLFGANVPWWLTFLVVSMVSAVLVRPLVRVQF